MRAWELMKETFFRRGYVWMVHVIWLALYGIFWWLFLPDPEEYGHFVLIWGGFLLPLALSGGILGDDITSGRICVLVTKPFWPGKLFIYRLLGLSLQGAVHFVLAAGVVFVLHTVTGRSTMVGLDRWLLSCWLLFNTFAALSASLSVVVKRAHNALLMFMATITIMIIAAMLMWQFRNHAIAPIVEGFFRYPFPPFKLLDNMSRGLYAKESLTVGGWKIPVAVACVAHSLLLATLYGAAGVLLFTRRQFLSERD
ncbi:MAG: hypothetical protein ABFE13_23690 [Phycisphaerales bacterium]